MAKEIKIPLNDGYVMRNQSVYVCKEKKENGTWYNTLVTYHDTQRDKQVLLDYVATLGELGSRDRNDFRIVHVEWKS